MKAPALLRLTCVRRSHLILKILCLMPFAVVGWRGEAQHGFPKSFTYIDPQRISRADPLKTVTTEADAPAGLLAYPAEIPANGADYTCNLLVMRTVAPGKHTQPATVLRYEPQSETVFYASISPDQRYVAVNRGYYVGLASQYHLLIWDRLRQRMLPGPRETLSAWQHYWSPDSKRIAFIRGGDSDGGLLPGMESIPQSQQPRLCVFELATGQVSVVSNAWQSVAMAWTRQGTLLYTAPSPHHHSLSLFETDAKGRRAREIVRQAAAPLPSPDGKWVAFEGAPPPDSEDRGFSVPAPPLSLMERASGKRRVVQAGTPIGTGRISAIWTPDSKRLIVVAETYRQTGQRGKDDRAQGTATVSVIEAATRHRRRLASLTAADAFAISHAEGRPQFRPIGVSPDGRWVCISAMEIAGRDGFTQRYLMHAINLKTGRALLLAQFLGEHGSCLEPDWCFDPIHAPQK